MKPLRIALFHNLPSGGAKRHTLEQLRELQRRGYTIDEYTLSTADLAFLPLAPYVARTQVYDLPWAQLRPVRVPGVGPYMHWWQNARNLARLDKLSQRIAAEIDAGGYDLAFVKDCMFVTAPPLLRHLKTPSVFYMHSISGQQGAQRRGGHEPLKQRVARWPGRAHARMVEDEVVRNLRGATRVLTNSYFTREVRLAMDGTESHVVYPGVDIEVFRPDSDAQGRYVLAAGNLGLAKGHWFVVEALGRIPQAIRPALKIAVPSPDAQRQWEMEQYAARHGVTVEIVSARTSEEMACLYANASLLAFAPVMEWLGLVALEAMACGIPVVGVREGGLRETVQDGVTGYLVDREPEQFAAAVRRLLEDEVLRRTLGCQARQAVEAYWTWPRAVDDLEAQFAAALAVRQGS